MNEKLCIKTLLTLIAPQISRSILAAVDNVLHGMDVGRNKLVKWSRVDKIANNVLAFPYVDLARQHTVERYVNK